MSMNDGTCRKCGRRMGWTGKLTDKPTCPKCGEAPSEKELKQLANCQKAIDDLIEIMKVEDE